MPADTPAKYVVELNASEAFEPTSVGSKAASVAELIRTGATAPRGFSVHSRAFDEFVEPVAGDLANILASVDPENAASAFEASDSIYALLEPLPFPAGLPSDIAERVRKINSTGNSQKSLAVRSSATAEDLEGASFAGMYDTFLDATNADSVLKRIRNVWASYYTGRAISYRQRIGIPHETGSMAVLVMELIDAEAGGVVFTRDPRDGNDQILINVVLGLGEGVVSGETEADSFTLDSKTHEIIVRNVIDKTWMIVAGKAGTTKRIPVPADRRSNPALTDAQLVAVAKAAASIKTTFGDDRDIEFAIANNTVHILQSRPITTGSPNASEESDFPYEWDDPSEADLYWTSGFKPEPTIPLFIDFMLMAGDSEKRCVEATGQHMARRYLKKVFNGHVYAAAPAGNIEEVEARLFKHHLQGRRYLARRTTYYYENVEPVLVTGVAELERVRPTNDAPLPELIANLRVTTRVAVDHEADLHWRGWAGYKETNSLHKLFAEITGQPEIEAAVLTAGLDHMTSRLISRLIGMGALVKSDPWLVDVFEKRTYNAIFERGAGKRRAVRRFRSRFRSMMDIWGQRNGTGYGTAWSPEDPTWNMKPEIVLDSIGSYSRQDLDELAQTQSDIKRQRVSAIRSVRRKIGTDKKLRKQFEFELYKGTQHNRMMENHNYLIEQRSIGEYRESVNRVGTALVKGGWLDTPDDVFYLRLAQLESAATANDYSNIPSLVLQAKDEFSENSKREAPEFLGTKPPEKEDDTKNDDEQPLRGPSEDGLLLHGEPSSPGSFTGTARVVITRTSTPPNVKKGDILVTENTGPDWVPVFPLIGALILDSGSNFQHASLICREYGIPCVIQTKEATNLITNGQVVAVDGTAGTVTLNPLV